MTLKPLPPLRNVVRRQRRQDIRLRFAEEVERYDMAQRREPIFPGDLFPLEIVTREVPDRNLDDL